MKFTMETRWWWYTQISWKVNCGYQITDSENQLTQAFCQLSVKFQNMAKQTPESEKERLLRNIPDRVCWEKAMCTADDCINKTKPLNDTKKILLKSEESTETLNNDIYSVSGYWWKSIN